MVQTEITNHTSYATHDTYHVTFSPDTILTTVTDDASAVSDWISDVLHVHRHRLRRLIVGLDFKWRPSFSPGPLNPIATVQICVGRRCLVYQIIHSDGDIPESLADFLSDDDFTFVGIRVKHDLGKLYREYGIEGGARAMDLSKLTAEVYGAPEMRYSGLTELSSFVLGADFEQPRRVMLSEWDNRWLTEEQVQYACVDAYVSFQIGRVLKASQYAAV